MGFVFECRHCGYRTGDIVLFLAHDITGRCEKTVKRHRQNAARDALKKSLEKARVR